MSNMKPVFKWEGDPQYDAGVMVLWPDTHREMRLQLPDFRTAHALGMAISGVTKEAFVPARARHTTARDGQGADMTTEGAIFFYLAILCAAVWGVLAWITGNHYGYIATGVYMVFALAMWLTEQQSSKTGKY